MGFYLNKNFKSLLKLIKILRSLFEDTFIGDSRDSEEFVSSFGIFKILKKHSTETGNLNRNRLYTIQKIMNNQEDL